MRRRYDSHVHATSSSVADSLEGVFLQESENLGLETKSQIADLVQEECAPVRKFETTHPIANSSGEGAPYVPEELALEKFAGYGRAVDRDKRSVRPMRCSVESPGDEFLSRSALTSDENGGVVVPK